MSALKIGIILGSTRPGRNGEGPARWILDVANERGGAQYDLIDATMALTWLETLSCTF